MSSITLHKTKGVNPVLSYCCRCHGESSELFLLGANDGIYECSMCQTKQIGQSKLNHCPDKYCHGFMKKIRSVDEYEKLPSSEPCETCKLELKSHKEEVAKGGVYWKCDKCHNSGVIKVTSDFAAEVRKAHNIFAPDPCGVDFTDDADTMCPVCSGIVNKK